MLDALAPPKTSVDDFAIELARREDDPAIQRLLASNPVPGRIALTFEHAPSYFLGSQTLGRFCQVGVARHRPTGEIVGLASRAIRPRFVNGLVEEVGYLTHLRVDRRFRGRWLVPRFGRFLRQHHADGRVKGYFTIIGEENAKARGVLVDRPRGSIPAHREIGHLHSLAIILRGRKPIRSSVLAVNAATERELGEIVVFLRRWGAEKQLFPAYTEEDFGPGSAATLGFRLDDFLLARRNGELVGVVGLWDRSETKQMVVRGYSRSLLWSRPLLNIGARLVGARGLPTPGERIQLAYASFICTAGNDPEVFAALLPRLYNLAAERAYAFLVVDLAAGDPLLSVASRYAHVSNERRLYSVCWDHESEFHERLDGRIAYVDTAAL